MDYLDERAENMKIIGINEEDIEEYMFNDDIDMTTNFENEEEVLQGLNLSPIANLITIKLAITKADKRQETFDEIISKEKIKKLISKEEIEFIRKKYVK